MLLTHGDSIDRVCDKFKICATSSTDIIAGIFNEQARIYGVQFHPEVDLTVQGKKMLSNFLLEIARLTPSFTISCRKEECIRYIREKVGNNKVLVRFMDMFSVEIMMMSFSSRPKIFQVFCLKCVNNFSFCAAVESTRQFVQLC